MRQQINVGKTAYHPNSTGGGCPFQAKVAEGGFSSFEERIDARKVRARSKSFMDFFSQATLFFNSQSEAEQSHIVDALCFELGKLETPAIRERMVGLLAKVSAVLAKKVAEGLGIAVPQAEEPLNRSYGADANPADYQNQPQKQTIEKSAALSMANTIKDTIKTRQIAILAAYGVDGPSLTSVKAELEAEGAQTKIIAPTGGSISNSKGAAVKVDMSFLTAASVLFDAVYIPAGAKSIETLKENADAIHFINEAYRHCKAIAADGEALELLNETYVGKKLKEGKPDALAGIITGEPSGTGGFTKDFIQAIAHHRFWEREKKDKVPA
jgi:catalase